MYKLLVYCDIIANFGDRLIIKMKKILVYVFVFLFFASLGSCAYKTCATYSFNENEKKEQVRSTKTQVQVVKKA